MNYIRHLNGLFEKINRDDRMTAQHISLYMSIFQLWNRNRFKNPVPVSREELMTLSRIGGRNTYGRCMKELDRWGYIRYSPTGNLHTGWKVSCIPLDEQFSEETITKNTESDNTGGIRNDTGDNTGSGTRTKTGEAHPSGSNNATGEPAFSGIETDTAVRLKKDTGRKTGRWSESLENIRSSDGPINIINNINKKKKKKKKKNSPKILKIQTKKMSYGTNPLHVENDKNYAEPL